MTTSNSVSTTVLELAAEAGVTLLPWQQQVVERAFEVDPVTGEFTARPFVLLPPRWR